MRNTFFIFLFVIKFCSVISQDFFKTQFINNETSVDSIVLLNDFGCFKVNFEESDTVYAFIGNFLESKKCEITVYYLGSYTIKKFVDSLFFQYEICGNPVIYFVKNSEMTYLDFRFCNSYCYSIPLFINPKRSQIKNFKKASN